MAITFNGSLRRIEITDSADVNFNVERDLYSAWKDWKKLPGNGGFAFAFRTIGGDPTITGQNAPKYFFLINYWVVYINNGELVNFATNLYTDDFNTPFVIGPTPGSGVGSNKTSDAVNVNEEEIKNQSFLLGRVSIDKNGLGTPGIVYPTGSDTQPSSNWGDANAIASVRKLTKYNLNGNMVMGAEAANAINGTSWWGNSPENSTISFDGRNTTDCVLNKLTITGSLNGPSTFYNCTLGSLGNPITGFDGIAYNPIIGGDITFPTSPTTNPIGFINGRSGFPGTDKPDYLFTNITSTDFHFRDYIGGAVFKNISAAINVSFDGSGATLEIDSSCIAGTINVGGIVELIDNSGPGCTVITGRNVTSLAGGGSSVWTTQEKDDLITDLETTKRQAAKAANNTIKSL